MSTRPPPPQLLCTVEILRITVHPRPRGPTADTPPPAPLTAAIDAHNLHRKLI